jgi:hypothetical protein
MISFKRIILVLSIICLQLPVSAQLFEEDFGTAWASISTTKWPTACRNAANSYNTSSAPCGSTIDRAYYLNGFGSYITTQAISIPAANYELSFSYSFDYSVSSPEIEIRSGGSCGTTLLNTYTLSNTSGICSPHSIDLSAYAGQTIFIRFVSNTSSRDFYFDDILVDLGSGGGSSCLLEEDFGTAFTTINSTNWPAACRSGSPSNYNTSIAPCGSGSDYAYGLSGFNVYITSKALNISSASYSLDFDYSFNYSFSLPVIEIRSGGSCGTTLLNTYTLSNTSGICTPHSIDLSAYAGQTIFIRFISKTSSASFYIDNITVCDAGGSGTVGADYKFADNFNDGDLVLNYAGNDGDEACSGCGNWVLQNGASMELAPSGTWNGNSRKTEAFPANMSNVYYVKLERDEYIESPTIDMSAMTGFKISFYAKSSSSSSGGGDSWSSISDHLRLQVWDGSSWITLKDITEGTSVNEDKITSALPLNYFCFTAYADNNSPGNYYYNAAPNVNPDYFHSDFKFRIIFEGGFSGAPFAWVDDISFRADDDGYSTMIPCGISFWNEPDATGYGQDNGTSGNMNAEKGVELEVDGSVSFPPNWATQANDGDYYNQIFGFNQSIYLVFCVLSEQEINFAYPKVQFYAPSMGWQSSTLSKDNNYTGPGWKYYAVEYVSCDLAGGSIAEPTDEFTYYYHFQYGSEFIPLYYHLNTSGIETGGGATTVAEAFDAPDVISTDDCGTTLPIELLSFSAKLVKDQVILDWTTISESNSDYFLIERSADGVSFNAIGKLDAAGNSNFRIDYSYIDDNPLSRISYYRLKEVDYDGSTSYSDIAVVEIGKQEDILIYPNPAVNRLYIKGEVENPEHIKIYNLLGQNLTNKTIIIEQSKNNFSLNIEDLAKGIYILKIKESAYRFSVE